jgi:hypothetical protein
MLQEPRNALHVSADAQPIFRELGIDAEAIFTHPLIKPWRVLPERENCTLDAALTDGRTIRWHVKRFQAVSGPDAPALQEVRGHELLIQNRIPTANLIGWGRLIDGRSFTIFEDLAGYSPADKLVEAGTPFARLLESTADLAAQLHRQGLHHRDLYLCHFFAKIEADRVDVRLIDSARVRPLPAFITRTRWIVKDLAQFWYSTSTLPITDEQRTEWLDRYTRQRNLNPASLRRKIERKVNWIARHDVQLRKQQPNRNISIPGRVK